MILVKLLLDLGSVIAPWWWLMFIAGVAFGALSVIAGSFSPYQSSLQALSVGWLVAGCIWYGIRLMLKGTGSE